MSNQIKIAIIGAVAVVFAAALPFFLGELFSEDRIADYSEGLRTAIRFEAEVFDASQGHMEKTTEDSNEGAYLSFINNGEWIRLDRADFGNKEKRTFHARVASKYEGGTINVYLNSLSGEQIASCSVSGTGGWVKFVTVDCELSRTISGKHTIYLLFKGPDKYLFNINWFEFRS
jgi:arabinoxylan arabinofuranohydrolase